MHLQAMFIMHFSFYKYLSKFIVLLGFFSFSWNKLVRCTRLNPTINNVYDDDETTKVVSLMNLNCKGLLSPASSLTQVLNFIVSGLWHNRACQKHIRFFN